MAKSVSYETKRTRTSTDGTDGMDGHGSGHKLAGKSAAVVVADEVEDWKACQSVGEYAKLNQAFAWFNECLFDGKLPEVFFTIARHRGAGGYFLPDSMNNRRFDENGERLPVEFKLHEISLMPDAMFGWTDRFVLSVLVHEMAHLWQAEFGKPSRGGYHNGQWADKMEEIGLMPSSLGTRDCRNPDNRIKNEE